MLRQMVQIGCEICARLDGSTDGEVEAQLDLQAAGEVAFSLTGMTRSHWRCRKVLLKAQEYEA
jgi:hypothetical protein